jgi:hypothetical protein
MENPKLINAYIRRIIRIKWPREISWMTRSRKCVICGGQKIYEGKFE